MVGSRTALLPFDGAIVDDGWLSIRPIVIGGTIGTDVDIVVDNGPEVPTALGPARLTSGASNPDDSGIPGRRIPESGILSPAVTSSPDTER